MFIQRYCGPAGAPRRERTVPQNQAWCSMGVGPRASLAAHLELKCGLPSPRDTAGRLIRHQLASPRPHPSRAPGSVLLLRKWRKTKVGWQSDGLCVWPGVGNHLLTVSGTAEQPPRRASRGPGPCRGGPGTATT